MVVCYPGMVLLVLFLLATAEKLPSIATLQAVLVMLTLHYLLWHGLGRTMMDPEPSPDLLLVPRDGLPSVNI